MPPSASSPNDSGSQPYKDLFLLNDQECWWRDNYEMFIKHGYELRPRYRPGWKPSWMGTKKRPFLCEDGQSRLYPKTMDAKRISDGKRIMMKRLVKGDRELEIARFLSSEEMLKDPRNRCVPVLDVFSEEDSHLVFMVMPLLTIYSEPPFATVDEAVDFVRQLLEGLVFMHDHNVAHRDCSSNNIMMDGDPIYPKGFLPYLPILDANAKMARPRRRRDVGGVKYYFIDFGISSWFDGTEGTRLVTGRDGLDREVPELRQSEPYDPFPVDIFILGNLFKGELTSTYSNVGFLESLFERMTQQNPCDRPTAKEALAMFNEIVREQHPRCLRWALLYLDMSKFQKFVWNSESLLRELLLLIKSPRTFLRTRNTTREGTAKHHLWRDVF